jgi:HAD superfamily hydrolase (TIGR01509 family)
MTGPERPQPRLPPKAVVFDAGETLVDETGLWQRAADLAGVPRFTLMGTLGGLISRGEHHRRVWDLLGAERPDAGFEAGDFYPDALPCLAELRSKGLRVGVVGNTPREFEQTIGGHVDWTGSSERWGVAKPAAEFFSRIVAEAGAPPGEIAYVGDRVDNDVEPALRAGMLAVHLRRGPWGHLHEPPPDALRAASLAELPELLGV